MKVAATVGAVGEFDPPPPPQAGAATKTDNKTTVPSFISTPVYYKPAGQADWLQEFVDDDQQRPRLLAM